MFSAGRVKGSVIHLLYSLLSKFFTWLGIFFNVILYLDNNVYILDDIKLIIYIYVVVEQRDFLSSVENKKLIMDRRPFVG